MLLWILIGVGALLILAPVILTYPIEALMLVGGACAICWLARKGLYRFALGALLVFTLGATSTMEAWASAATVGRPVALGLLLFAIASRKQPSSRSSLPQSARVVFGLLYVLAVLAIASAIWSVSWVETVTQGCVFLGLVIVIHLSAILRWGDRGVLTGDVAVAVQVASVVLLAGLFAHWLGLLPPTFSARYQGLLNNPNMAAQISIVTGFLAWGLFRETRSKWHLLPIGVALATIVLSQSRAAILAVIIGVAFQIVRSGMRGFLFLMGAGLVVAIAVGSGIAAPLLSLFARFGEVAAGDTLSGRSFIWEVAFALIEARPIGYGWGSTSTLFSSLIEQGQAATSAHSIHNSYLQTAVEGGILALVLTGLIYLVLLFKVAVDKPTGIVFGLSGAIVAGFVGQFSESGIYGVGQAYPYLYWMAVAGFLATLARATPEPDRSRSVIPKLRRVA